MSEVKVADAISEAWNKLTSLLYLYDRIRQTDPQAAQAWKKANDTVFAVIESDDLGRVQEAVKAVDELEVFFKEIAKRWDEGRQNNPPPDPSTQQQFFTKKDEEFILQQRRLLVDVTPVSGFLYYFAEQGTEGAYWSVSKEWGDDPDGEFILEGGDRLVIYNQDGTVFFDEILIQDVESGWRPYHTDKPYGFGQQGCGGLFVHWIPKGKSPREWAKIFNESRGKKVELYRLPKDRINSI